MSTSNASTSYRETDDKKKAAIPPVEEERQKPTLPARWYRSVKFYLAIVEILLISVISGRIDGGNHTLKLSLQKTATAIHFRPHWFASTAYDHLAAGNPTFILEQPFGDMTNVGFCPIVDPHCAQWQLCRSTAAADNVRQFACRQREASIVFPEELLSSVLAGPDADETNKTSVLDCLKMASDSTTNSQPKTDHSVAIMSLGHRLNDVRLEADSLWHKIQRRQTNAIRSILRVVLVVVATMLAACFMLFARYWWEKSVLSRCWNVTDFTVIDLKPEDDDDDTAAWDHRLTLFFCVLGTAIVPVILLAHHSTSNTKPIQVLAGQHHLASSSASDINTTFSMDSSLASALLCQTPSAEASHSRTCVQWNTCPTMANIQTAHNGKNVVVIDCSNGTVHDFNTFATHPHSPPSRRSGDNAKHSSMFGNSHSVKADMRCSQNGDDGASCSEHSESDSPAAGDKPSQRSVCIQVLVEELNNLKHLSGSRLTHVSMQGQILFYLYCGLSMFFAAFVAIILFCIKTVYLLTISSQPLVMSRLQWLCYEVCVYLNGSDHVFTKQSRAILARKLASDEKSHKSMKLT